MIHSPSGRAFVSTSSFARPVPDYLSIWRDIDFKSAKKLCGNTQGGLIKQVVLKVAKDVDETGMPEQITMYISSGCPSIKFV